MKNLKVEKQEKQKTVLHGTTMKSCYYKKLLLSYKTVKSYNFGALLHPFTVLNINLM